MMHYLQYHLGPHKTTGVTKDQKYSLAYPVTEACQAGEMDETFRHRFRDPSMCDYLYVHTWVDSNLGLYWYKIREP